jgi:hypothetical protein
LSISMNLVFGIFKYYNFLQIFFSTFEWFWTANESATIKCCSPVGISLYFSWSILCNWHLFKRIKAEYNFVDYSLFVSYFPC